MNDDTVTVDTDEVDAVDAYLNDDIVDRVSSQLNDSEAGRDAAVIWAVDVTLRSVVEWLRKQGHDEAADDLETFGGV